MKYLLLLFLIFVFAEGKGQNLVPNPSFEELDFPEWHHLYTEPGWLMGGKGLVKEWYSPTMFGPGIASSKNGGHTGNIAAKFHVYNKITKYAYNANHRDFYAVKLKQPLDANEEYEICFYVKEGINNFYAVNGIGFAFLSDSLHFDTKKVPDIEPVYVSPQILHSPEMDWIEIKTTYKAKGGEKYFMIGNFLLNQEVKVKKVKWNDLKAAEYFIDDVSVVPLKEIRPH